MRIGIIGSGIAGLATAWALTKAGQDVTLFEQAAIPNPQGASGDQHRIIRRGYGSLDGYARLIEGAFTAWSRLWDDLGTTHYRQTGVLCVSREVGDEADGYLAGYDRLGTPYERFEPADAMARFPYLDADHIRYAAYCDDGGVLFSHRIALGLANWLTKHGAILRDNTRVLSVDLQQASVKTKAGTDTFDHLIITAGAWLGELLPHYATRTTSHRTAVVYLKPPPQFAPAWEQAPAFLSGGGHQLDGYILPPVDGTGLKFGAGRFKTPMRASDAHPSDEAEGRNIRDAFAPIFRDLSDYQVTSTRSCVYTFTPDKHFFGAREGKAWVISACSGHGYKFGALIGERVAQAVGNDDADGLIHWLAARG